MHMEPTTHDLHMIHIVTHKTKTTAGVERGSFASSLITSTSLLIPEALNDGPQRHLARSAPGAACVRSVVAPAAAA